MKIDSAMIEEMKTKGEAQMMSMKGMNKMDKNGMNTMDMNKTDSNANLNNSGFGNNQNLPGTQNNNTFNSNQR